jgi:hypothetical protein
MINLIPKEEKKRMTTDFYFRITVLFLVLFGSCILIASIAILPSYFFSSMKNVLADTKLEIQKREPLPLLGEQSLLIIKDINKKLDLVESSEKNKFLPSQKVINSILLKKRPDIKITQILYENDVAKGKKISITGTAPSREVLLLFRKALEDSSNFKSINLPISNFVKGSNIQFYLNLIPS